jgi:hypothetical protein
LHNKDNLLHIHFLSWLWCEFFFCNFFNGFTIELPHLQHDSNFLVILFTIYIIVRMSFPFKIRAYYFENQITLIIICDAIKIFVIFDFFFSNSTNCLWFWDSRLK